MMQQCYRARPPSDIGTGTYVLVYSGFTPTLVSECGAGRLLVGALASALWSPVQFSLAVRAFKHLCEAVGRDNPEISVELPGMWG